MRANDDVPSPCTADPARWDVPATPSAQAILDARDQIESALYLCHGCPIELACRRDAYASPPEHDSVQGGVLWIDRKPTLFRDWYPRAFPTTVALTPRDPSSLRPCGTIAAYRRHRTRGEDACDACKAAVRTRDAARRGVAA